MTKALTEQLLVLAIGSMLDNNGGSMEQALDDIGIKNNAIRSEIKEWFGWEELEELPW